MCCAFSAQLHTHCDLRNAPRSHQQLCPFLHICESHSVNSLYYYWQMWLMSRFPPHQNSHSSCSQTLLSFIFSSPVSFHLCDKPPLFSNLWDLSRWPRQAGCSERERMPNRVVTATTWVTALLPPRLARNCKETENSALMWLAKLLHPKLLLSHIASSNLHPK